MALKAGVNGRIYLSGYDISGRVNRFSVALPRDFEDVTCFGNKGHKHYPTLHRDTFSFDAFYDATSGNITEIMNTLRGTSGIACLCMGAAQSDKAIAGQGIFQQDYPIEMPVEGMLRITGDFAFSGMAVTGYILQAKATQTKNDNGTGVDKGAVHKVNDTDNLITASNATDLDTLKMLLIEIKDDYNTHRVSTTYHDVADTTNNVDAVNATDLATSLTLANQIKAKFNAHRSQTGVHPADDAHNAIINADAVNLGSAIILANEEKLNYNSHLTSSSSYGAEAYLQVFGCGDSDKLIVKVQDDDDAEFAGANDLITFTAANGVTSQRKCNNATCAKTGAVQRYVRVSWTADSYNDVSFAVIFIRD